MSVMIDKTAIFPHFLPSVQFIGFAGSLSAGSSHQTTLRSFTSASFSSTPSAASSSSSAEDPGRFTPSSRSFSCAESCTEAGLAAGWYTPRLEGMSAS